MARYEILNLKRNSPVWRLSPRRWPPRWAAHDRPWLRAPLAHALWGSPGPPTHTWSLATTTLSASPYSLPSLGTDNTRYTIALLARWGDGLCRSTRTHNLRRLLMGRWRRYQEIMIWGRRPKDSLIVLNRCDDGVAWLSVRETAEYQTPGKVVRHWRSTPLSNDADATAQVGAPPLHDLLPAACRVVCAARSAARANKTLHFRLLYHIYYRREFPRTTEGGSGLSCHRWDTESGEKNRHT